MARLRLYDNAHSSNALKVRYLLELLGLRYEAVRVPFARPRPDWLTQLNPFGTIPVLIDGDVVLGESNTILRYLAESRERPDLYPSDARERARVDWLLDAWSTQVRPRLWPLEAAAIFHTSIEDGGGRLEDADPAAVAAALPDAEHALDRFERLVTGKGTVAKSLTIADCAIAPSLWRSRRLPLDFSRLPKLEAIRTRLAEDAAFLAAEPRV